MGLPWPNQLPFHFEMISRFAVILTVCATLLVTAAAQNVDPSDRQGQQSGASTGVAHAPVKDALSRPITAGGFVDNAPVVFSDITHAAGLDKFHHFSGTRDKAT